MAQISTLKSHGVAPAGFIWVHAQNEADNRLRLRAAEAGGWVEFDGISSAAAETFALTTFFLLSFFPCSGGPEFLQRKSRRS